MGSGSRYARGERFIKAFGKDITDNIGSDLGTTLEVIEEGLDVIDGWEEVHYYVIVRRIKQPEIQFRLISSECIFDPENTDEEEIIDYLTNYSGLTRDEVIFKLQEAGLR